MTKTELSHKKPLLYGLLGFIAGTVAASLIIYSVRSEPSSTINSNSVSGELAATEVSSPQPSPTTPTAIPGMRGMMAQPDQHFIVMMIPHHEDAVAMANLALKRSQHPELKKLAEAIKTTQTQEIQQMRSWYKQWYGTDVPDWSPAMGRGMHRNRMASSPMPGMMGRGAMGRGAMGTNLAALEDAASFDQEFLAQMIPHHQMAIMMSTMVANSATHPEIRDLAQSIVRSQSAEIEQMQQWYQTWYSQ
jgi:uncharacterized protein (DUF305 family)